MCGHVRWTVFAARLAVKMARLGERASVTNVVSQKTPAGCCKSRHSSVTRLLHVRWAMIHEVCTER